MADYQFTVTQTGIICVDANSEEEAIQQWNDAIAHEFDLEYLNEKPKFTGEIWEHDG